jgi:hypothetical protein
MKGARGAAAAALALVAAGCVSERPPLVLAAVGPAAIASPASGPGMLEVHSQTAARNPERAGSGAVRTHTGYRVESADGSVVEHVENEGESHGAGAERVELSPGDYRVHALAEGVGPVVVPVAIVSGSLTAVYLDAAGMPARDAKAATALVTLPDGRIVGAAAPRRAP